MNFRLSTLVKAMMLAASMGVGASMAQNVSDDAQTSSSAVAPVQAPASNLSESIDRMLQTHPEIRARWFDFESNTEGKKVMIGSLLPQVNAQGWVGKEWRSKVPTSDNYNWNRPGWNVSLRQLLWDGMSTINNVRQLGFEKLSSYYTLLSSIDNLSLEVTRAYLDVQRYRALEVLARDNLDMHQRTLGQLRERAESGVGRGADLEQASGRLALAQTNLLTEVSNLNDVSQRYVRLVGEQPAAELAETPDFALQLPKEPSTFQDSLRANPGILAKQALVQAAQAGVNSAKGNFSPKFELVAETGRDRPTNQLSDRDVHSSRVQVMATFNLFKGGADSARVRQTMAQQYAARDVRDYTCRNVQQELAIAWNRIQRLHEQLPFLREHEMATSKVRVAYTQQFLIGQRSLLDLLDTENELFDARRALVAAEFDLKIEEAQWLAMSSRLLPVVNLSQPYQAPDEQQDLGLAQEDIARCAQPVPDGRNLRAAEVVYQEGMLPPRVRDTMAEPS